LGLVGVFFGVLEGKEATTLVVATEQELWHLIRETLKARLNDLVWNLHDGTACVGGSEQ
jgi:hypothetical protein